jgi:hypothetical protein
METTSEKHIEVVAQLKDDPTRSLIGLDPQREFGYNTNETKQEEKASEVQQSSKTPPEFTLKFKNRPKLSARPITAPSSEKEEVSKTRFQGVVKGAFEVENAIHLTMPPMPSRKRVPDFQTTVDDLEIEEDEEEDQETEDEENQEAEEEEDQEEGELEEQSRESDEETVVQAPELSGTGIELTTNDSNLQDGNASVSVKREKGSIITVQFTNCHIAAIHFHST